MERLLGPFLRSLRKAHRRGHVVMIHVGRSGSTVIADLLDQHPLIKWDGEIYQRVFRERERADHSLPPIVDVDPVNYLIERSRSVFGRYYGFEVKFFHLRALGTDLARYLDALDRRLPDLQYIVLERRNTLRVVVSTLVSRATGMWHLGANTSPPRNRVHVNVNAVFVNRADSSLIDLLDEFARDFSELERLVERRPCLHLTYEEDVAENPHRAYRRICEHLHLPAHESTVRRSRTNPYPLCDLIENFDEVWSRLRGTDYEWMLEDAPPERMEQGLRERTHGRNVAVTDELGQGPV